MLNICVLNNLTNHLGNQMRNLIIFFITLILFAYPLFADSHKRKIFYGWETSHGIQLRGFGEKSVHPLYEGDAENGQPNGQGTGISTYGSKYVGGWKGGELHGQGRVTWSYENVLFQTYVGEWKDGKMWNVTGYGKDGNINRTWVNGRRHK